MAKAPIPQPDQQIRQPLPDRWQLHSQQFMSLLANKHTEQTLRRLLEYQLQRRILSMGRNSTDHQSTSKSIHS
ncbi:MAG: hypothetical protein HQL73_13935 [Magnetococcales bacterium]|nr:hypothetical protein [Magnetococcales bacterium]